MHYPTLPYTFGDECSHEHVESAPCSFTWPPSLWLRSISID